MKNTAVVFIGYQNDYFRAAGALAGFLEDKESVKSALTNTESLVRALSPSDTLLIQTPIVFTEDYRELNNPVGILRAIQVLGAFRKDCYGSETVMELRSFGDRIVKVTGKRGLNAFTDTCLGEMLRRENIEHVVIAGCVTSICVDSAGRCAFDLGFQVSVLEDCTVGRTKIEQDFYIANIFPLYANVLTSTQLQDKLVA